MSTLYTQQTQKVNFVQCKNLQRSRNLSLKMSMDQILGRGNLKKVHGKLQTPQPGDKAYEFLMIDIFKLSSKCKLHNIIVFVRSSFVNGIQN